MKVDLLGVAAVIAALATLIGTLGGIMIQLRTLKIGQAKQEEQTKSIRTDVDSNMTAVDEMKKLHDEGRV